MIAANADALGTPRLKVVPGEAPATYAGQPAPDAVFIGGGIWIPGVFETAWAALKPGGTHGRQCRHHRGRTAPL